jgi:hypothetical protein
MSQYHIANLLLNDTFFIESEDYMEEEEKVAINLELPP